MMPHWNLGHARPVPICVNRNETMHLAVKLNALQRLPPIGFQGASIIVQIDPRNRRDEPVGKRAWQITLERGVLPLLPPARDEIVALIQFGQELRNIGRIILKIAIHGDEDISLGKTNPGHESRRLSGITAQLDEAQLRPRQLPDNLARLIDAAVVHHNDLVGKAESFEAAKESRQKLLEVFRLVENGQNDRNQFRAHREDLYSSSHGRATLCRSIWGVGECFHLSLRFYGNGGGKFPDKTLSF